MLDLCRFSHSNDLVAKGDIENQGKFEEEKQKPLSKGKVSTHLLPGWMNVGVKKYNGIQSCFSVQGLVLKEIRDGLLNQGR